MNAGYRATGFAVCLALIACGNKGDLYLDKVELSAEEKALLEANDVNEVQDVNDELDSDDAKKTKKKKAETPKSRNKT